MIEVELKFQYPGALWPDLQTKLEALPFAYTLKRINNLDVYYDTEDFVCLLQAVFLRIRNHQSLDIKFHEQADPEHNHCTERVFPLPATPLAMKEVNTLAARFLPGWQEANTLDEAFETNALKAFVQLKNRRLQYSYENLLVCLDEVEGLGSFLEIETSCEEGTPTEQAHVTLRNFISALDFPALEIVQTGYVEQWLRLSHPHVYQKLVEKGTGEQL